MVYARRKTLKKYIKNTIEKQLETKTVITNYANTIPDSGRTPLSNSIAGVAQGLTQSTRVGNSIRVTSMKCEWFFTGADSTNSIRVIIYIPKDPTAALSGLAFNQAPDLDQFTILRDFFICTGGTGGNCKRLQKWIRFNRGMRSGLHMQYSGAASTDITKNKLMIYMVSDSSAVSDPSVNGYVRVFYKDA